MKNTFITAEAGANHDRNEFQAFKLIDEAVRAKADAVKFQTYSSETLYSKYTPDFAGYNNITKLIKDIELPRSWQKTLKSYCDDNGIEFISTPFDEKAVDELYELGVKRFKIAGFECTDPRFVKYVASTQLPLIISLGIGTNLDTMLQIRNWILEVNDNPNITFLHCNNAYPTPYKDINLGHMQKMMTFPFARIGLSDHTEGILTPPIAVSLGAEVIEKHYTIDRTLPGPDHPFAIEPDELKDMVDNIRLVETMMGIKDTKYTKSEKEFSMARRSVIVIGDVKKGDVITKDNVTTKRPLLVDSIPAEDYYNVLGKHFIKDLSDDMILMNGDFE
ncbi:N-acetylneuraminate synthase [Candidatus Pacearchaeota archaeon]|jgi:sialic acid synthase SpsE|nr:N-acetylneuraminate synthase [Candidatus Pacearchaeota archaeon]|tara:strand:- start:3412 stop:4410 length:999 start_codon:yes stop_codon:yes gene_type:complete